METSVKTETLTISSPVFDNNGPIPSKYTCEGENVNPPLTVDDIPDGTKSLALIVEDPDAPDGTFDHWIIWNIHPTKNIIENSVQGPQGKNGFGKTKYLGPCPPSGTHRYFFKVYALDSLLNLRPGANKKTIEQAMQDHILASGEIMGLYKKTKSKGL